MAMSSMGVCWCFCLLVQLRLSGAYDVMDPSGNVTIKWDFQALRDDGYTVMVTIYNYQLYRHVESPGWKLSWTWPGDDVIWDMRGAEATEQGDCSRIKNVVLPHSCEKIPAIIDLAPGAPYNIQTRNCCRGGVLSSMIQDQSKYTASFQMSVGSISNISDPEVEKPSQFSLGLPGYTCSKSNTITPSKFLSGDGRRYTQALVTWEVICTYSQYVESPVPGCCVSLSTFYSETIVPCPSCACGCQGSPKAPQCLMDGEQLDNVKQPLATVVSCTNHMCPVRVHWHVKTGYKRYWRVKMTISNLDFVKNYSDWTLVVQHPNLESISQIFSFNYKPLLQHGDINDSGVFWGIKYYNDMLLNYGMDGNVQTELLLNKDPTTFSFTGGWAFPRRISFNGHECVMPPPDQYPKLPNEGAATAASIHHLSVGLILLLVFTLLKLI